MSTYTDIERELELEAPSQRAQAITIRLSDVKAEPIKWLWPGRIALGKLTIIAGDPGLGKSLLTAYLAAVVSKGYVWPLGDSPAPVGSVVLLSAEDDAADTIRPRLDAAEADCTRIHIVQAIQDIDTDGNPTQRMFSLKRDIAVLEELLPTLPDCRLLVIDPISAYLDGGKSHENADMRGLLAPLAKFAADRGIAVVLIQHLNKNSGDSAMYRSMGSIAFVAAARAAYIITKDRDNPERRLMMSIKNNLAKDNSGLAYSVISAENDAPVIAWELDPVLTTADEALTPSESNEEKTGTDWAVEVLQIELANGPVSAEEIHKQAKGANISHKTLRRAQEKLGIKPKKTDYKGGWVWALPGHEDVLKDEDAPSIDQDILGEEGHLGDTNTDNPAAD